MSFTQLLEFRKYLPLLIFSLSVNASTFDQLSKQAEKLLQKSQISQSNRRQSAFFLKLAKSFTEQNHFSLKTGFTRENLNEAENLSGLRRLNNEVFSLGFNYRDWGGLEGEVRTSRNSEIYQEPVSVDPENDFYTNTLRLSYELIREGKNGLTRSRSYTNHYQARANYYSNKNQSINIRQEFENHFIDSYITVCKLRALGSAKLENDKSLNKAKQSLKSKTMTYKDFLNIKVASNTLALQIAQLDNQFNIFVEQASKWQEAYKSFILSLKSKTLDCKLVIPSQTRIDIGKLVKKNPQTQSAIQTYLQSQNEINSTLATYKPSVKPFIQYSTGIESLTGEDNNEFSVGVEATWIIPSEKSQYDKIASYYKKNAAQKEKQAQQRAFEAQLRQTIRNLEVNRNLMKQVKINISNYEELLKTLKAQMGIGQADALGYATNYTQYISSKITGYDFLGSYLKSNFLLLNFKENIK